MGLPATLLALYARTESPSHYTDLVKHMLQKFWSLCRTKKESKDWGIHSDEIRQIFRVAIRLATQEPRMFRDAKMCRDAIDHWLIFPSLIRVCVYTCVCLHKSA